jgi:hypothetical protein
MRKYFIKDGNFKKGPFNLDQLKLEKIEKDSPIWFDELGEWVSANELEELEDYLQEKNTNNVFSSFPHSNNFNQPIEAINNFGVALNFNKTQYLNSISLLLFGIAVVGSVIVLFNS